VAPPSATKRLGRSLKPRHASTAPLPTLPLVSTDEWLVDTRDSYDAVASSYAAQVRNSISGDAHRHAALVVLADDVRLAGGGPVVDIGCGPGQVTAYLHGLGVDAFGIDLSPEMIAVARRDHPDLRFEVGSMTDLRLDDASVAGLIAWWSLIHVPDDVMPTVLRHFHRVLLPGAPLQVGFHVGETARLKTKGYGGHAMKVTVHRRQPDRVISWLRDAGFSVDAQWLCELDKQVPQAFLFAHRLP